MSSNDKRKNKYKYRYEDSNRVQRLENQIIFFMRYLKILLKYKLPDRLKKNKHSDKSKKGEVAVAAIVKNESSYILEWIAYYQVMGISKFYIYDNESTDNLKDVLKKYIATGIVNYKYFPGKNMQSQAYEDAVAKAMGKYSWLLTVDIDEFLYSPTNFNFPDWLSKVEDNVSQILIGWLIYGSGHQNKRTSGFVIERFAYHAPDEFIADYKSVVRPESVLISTNPHFYIVRGKTVDENMKRFFSYPFISKKGGNKKSSKKIFRINHYYSKSYEEFLEKANRGDANEKYRVPRDDSDFEEHDLNNVFDPYDSNFIQKIKDEVKKYK